MFFERNKETLVEVRIEQIHNQNNHRNQELASSFQRLKNEHWKATQEVIEVENHLRNAPHLWDFFSKNYPDMARAIWKCSVLNKIGCGFGRVHCCSPPEELELHAFETWNDLEESKLFSIYPGPTSSPAIEQVFIPLVRKRQTEFAHGTIQYIEIATYLELIEARQTALKEFNKQKLAFANNIPPNAAPPLFWEALKEAKLLALANQAQLMVVALNTSPPPAKNALLWKRTLAEISLAANWLNTPLFVINREQLDSTTDYLADQEHLNRSGNAKAAKLILKQMDAKLEYDKQERLILKRVEQLRKHGIY
jgi:hypothetical protein